MAPTIKDTALFAKRQYNGFNNDCDIYGNCFSRWDSWGRWVALAAIIVAALLVFFMLACFNSRRRRRHGMNPRYGTGWLAGKTPEGHNGPQYTNNSYYGGNYAQPAPPYVAPAPQYTQATGNTYNSNEGYYGQESGVELQTPQHAYVPQRGGDAVYAAPEGPPPTKADGIIR